VAAGRDAADVRCAVAACARTVARDAPGADEVVAAGRGLGAGADDVATAEVDAAAGETDGVEAGAEATTGGGAAAVRPAGCIGRKAGRVVAAGDVRAGNEAAACSGLAEALMRTASTAHPATPSEATAADSTRATGMGPVCQM
jgi:hypothetical protein